MCFTVQLSRFFVLSLRQLVYFISSQIICQVLFQLFSNSFFDVSLKLFSSRFVCLSRRELLYHITYNCSCQAFFCFWITAQRHGISCQILSAKCIIKKYFLFQLYLPYIYFYKTQLKSYTVFSLSSAAFLIFHSAPTWAWVIASHLCRRF